MARQRARGEPEREQGRAHRRDLGQRAADRDVVGAPDALDRLGGEEREEATVERAQHFVAPRVQIGHDDAELGRGLRLEPRAHGVGDRAQLGALVGPGETARRDAGAPSARVSTSVPAAPSAATTRRCCGVGARKPASTSRGGASSAPSASRPAT